MRQDERQRSAFRVIWLKTLLLLSPSHQEHWIRRLDPKYSLKKCETKYITRRGLYLEYSFLKSSPLPELVVSPSNIRIYRTEYSRRARRDWKTLPRTGNILHPVFKYHWGTSSQSLHLAASTSSPSSRTTPNSHPVVRYKVIKSLRGGPQIVYEVTR
jgi:hypothetical protein